MMNGAYNPSRISGVCVNSAHHEGVNATDYFYIFEVDVRTVKWTTSDPCIGSSRSDSNYILVTLNFVRNRIVNI